MNKPVIMMLAVVANFAGCDSVRSRETIIEPRFVTNENDNLTDAEEEELMRSAQITQFIVEVQSEGPSGLGYFSIWTEATIPFRIFIPSFKHDAVYQVTAGGTTNSPVQGPGDWRLGGFYADMTLSDRWDDFDVGLNCDGHRSGKLSVSAQTQAKWKYFKFDQMLNWERSAGPTNKEDTCPPYVSRESGGGGSKADEDPTYCWVEYTYDANTGEILSARVLYCEQ